MVPQPMNEAAYMAYCADEALRSHRHSLATRRQFLLMFWVRRLVNRVAPGLASLL